MKKGDLKRLVEVARDIRVWIVRMHTKSCSSHIGSALSCVEILVSLYFCLMRINPAKPKDNNRDRFILSKGHAVSALYATLARRGFFPKSMLNGYCINGGRMPGHSTKGSIPGIEASAGSLGHGLPMAVGMAVAGKYDRCSYRVFTLLGDGECDAGSVWEAALFGAHHKLDNLIAIIDYNKLQAFGRTNEVLNLEPFKKKWESFGWAVKESDGHNFRGIITTLKKAPFEKGRPSVFIAHTIKGKGISFFEDQIAWHYKSPDKRQCKLALKELNIL